MNRLKRYRLGAVLFGTGLLLAATQGCSDSSDDNVKPPDVNGGTKTTGGSGNKAGSSNIGGKSGSSTNTTAGTDDGGAPPSHGGTGGSSNNNNDEAGSGNEGGDNNPPIPACDKPEKGADGCFNCPKDKELEQWLNRCTDGDCVPFDNKARLPQLKADGSVPALPT